MNEPLDKLRCYQQFPVQCYHDRLHLGKLVDHAGLASNIYQVVGSAE